ncbi:MAG TPA: hypothetical protein PKG71_03795 [Candidatus Woesebacteria bacterium]|nr:hypothetical protein [Candidatus Woesebacteria bacterium]
MNEKPDSPSQEHKKTLDRRGFLYLLAAGGATMLAGRRILGDPTTGVTKLMNVGVSPVVEGDPSQSLRQEKEASSTEIMVHNGLELVESVKSLNNEFFAQLRIQGKDKVVIALHGDHTYTFDNVASEVVPLPNSYPSLSGELMFSDVAACLSFIIPSDFSCVIASTEGRKKFVFPHSCEVGMVLNGGGKLLVQNIDICGGGFRAHPESDKDKRPIQGLLVVHDGIANIERTTFSTEHLQEATSHEDAGNMSGVMALGARARVFVTQSSFGNEQYPMKWDSLFAHLGGTVLGAEVTIFQDRGCCAGATGKESRCELFGATIAGPTHAKPWKGYGLFGEQCKGSLTNCQITASMWGLNTGPANSELIVNNTTVTGSPLPVTGDGQVIFDGKSTFIIRREANLAHEGASADGFMLSGPLERAQLKEHANVVVIVPAGLDYQFDGVPQKFAPLVDTNRAIIERLDAGANS